MSGKKPEKKQPDKNTPIIAKEIQGLIFLLAAIILAGSLFSYYPSDRVFWNVTGELGEARNLLGTVGAHIAGGLFSMLGFASFWLVIFFVAIAVLSFRGRDLSSPSTRIPSAVVLLVSFSALLTLQAPDALDFRKGQIMAGGLVGLHVAELARGLLNHFGAAVILATLSIISLMIITRISINRIFSWSAKAINGIFRQTNILVTKKRERKLRARRTTAARDRLQSRPKVTIAPPQPEPLKKLEQERFSFMNIAGKFKLPSLDYLDDPPERKRTIIQNESLEMNARRLERKLADFSVQGEVLEILPGPVITMYEFKPAPGIKISKIAGLSDDLALALRAPGIRIVAPIPGKAAIGIEIPNNQRENVFLKEILSSAEYKESRYKLPIALGKDITGGAFIADLAKMPHLLMAGATGAGKSVSLNTIIMSLLFKTSPDMVRFLLIDPKRIELSSYHDIPNLLHPVVTQTTEATKALKWVVREMERRYMLLSDRSTRNIDTYNRKILKEREKDSPSIDNHSTLKPLPYIVVIIDELADLMMTSSKEVEDAIARLAQMARASGIHLLLATQRPSVDVLTGVIKANFSARISFQVSTKIDSRTILDSAGAETLLGEGDMLFTPPGVGRIIRIHGAYISETEVSRVTDFLRNQMKPDYDDSIRTEIEKDETEQHEEMDMDEKYDQAVEVVLKTGQASISMLQRRLRVGYNRAARMIEVMETQGIVGPSDGVRPREVFGRRGG